MRRLPYLTWLSAGPGPVRATHRCYYFRARRGRAGPRRGQAFRAPQNIAKMFFLPRRARIRPACPSPAAPQVNALEDVAWSTASLHACGSGVHSRPRRATRRSAAQLGGLARRGVGRARSFHAIGLSAPVRKSSCPPEPKFVPARSTRCFKPRPVPAPPPPPPTPKTKVARTSSNHPIASRRAPGLRHAVR